MADSSIRELQVSAKQLVFLFMASVVVLVAVFLLGVSVGRGVRDRVDGTEPLAETASAAPVDPSQPVPPPTEVPKGAEVYSKLPDGGDGANAAPIARPESTPTAVPATEPPDIDEAAAPQKAAPPPPPAPAPKAEPAPKPAHQPAELPAPPKPGSGWSVQVNAFRSRENADRQMSQLKAKGYPAYVLRTGNLFRVRVGPYSERAEADRIAGKLKQEGLGSSVTR